MIYNNAIIPRLAPRPVPTSVPFTYRDGITTLELIECVKRNLDTLQSEFNGVVDEVNKTLSGVDDSLNSALVTMSAELESLRTELIRLINETQGSGVYSNVVYGNDTSALQIMGDVYDNTRNHALFWSDYDNMELQAFVYDALELTARDYDLRATAVDNCVPGDFPGRSQFPYGKSIPEGKPADVYLTQDSADAKYVRRNPTVANFETTGERA